MYYKLTLRRGPSLLGELIILRSGLPFTVYVDAFNPIPIGCCHVTFIYGLIPAMAGRNWVKAWAPYLV
jgi:hypothetical protein